MKINVVLFVSVCIKLINVGYTCTHHSGKAVVKFTQCPGVMGWIPCMVVSI